MWRVLLVDEFKGEFLEFNSAVQDKLYALRDLLEEFGPTLGRPTVDTLKGSKYKNMKELRFDADDGVWRVAFAFDLKRAAILLIAGDKSGVSQTGFYRELIRKADQRFDAHLLRLKEEAAQVKAK